MEDNTRITHIDGCKVEYVGAAGNCMQIYYSLSLNQVYLFDEETAKTTTLTHEEYINICDMRTSIEGLSRQSQSQARK